MSGQRKDAWTASQDEAIVTMRAAQRPWNDIAARVGRTVDSCGSRYRALVPPDERVIRQLTRWTDEENDTLFRLLGERARPRTIAAALNKPVKVVHARIQYLQRTPRRKLHTELVSRVWVPPARLEDRDRRMNAELDLTAMFFGDPKPGQSALDKKQGAYA